MVGLLFKALTLTKNRSGVPGNIFNQHVTHLFGSESANTCTHMKPFGLEHDLNPLEPEIDPQPAANVEDLLAVDLVGKVHVELEELLDLGHVLVVLPPKGLVDPYQEVTSLVPALKVGVDVTREVSCGALCAGGR